MIFIFFICNDPTTTELYTLSLHDALPISDWYSWIEFFVDASGRMAKKLNNLLDHANILAEEGIEKCTSHTERYIYILTFSIPNITAIEAAKQVKVAPTTARRALNALVEKDLLFKDPSQRRNVEYFNYDVLDLFDR